MNDPFNTIPYNKSSTYVMVTLDGGCELYIPVDGTKYDRKEIIEIKEEFQFWIDNHMSSDASLAK